MTGRWEIRIPAPFKILSYNQDQKGGSSARRKKWRDEAYRRIEDERVPTGLTRIRLDIQIRFPAAADRDETNYHPTVGKPLTDACGPERRTKLGDGRVIVAKGHGIVRDDNSRYLHCSDDPHITFGIPVGRDDPRWPHGLVILTITDLSQETTP